MPIFDSKMHYDNCLIFIDREWSTSEVAALRARFADGPFELNYDGTDVEFTKHFKERLKSFYEKVLKDYDEALGYDKPTYEDCFYTMIDDFKIINCPYWISSNIYISEVDRSEDD